MPRLKFSSEEHWKHFAQFCKLELASGGPDPHMVMAGQASIDAPLHERFWRAGCYIAVYNSPFAEVLWQAWGSESEFDRALLLGWLEKNFFRITTRRERKCVRRPEWMAQYLIGYHDFIILKLPQLLVAAGSLEPVERYEHFWEEVLTVPRLGRYVAIKLLEFYRRYCSVDVVIPDIRPSDGWSPREMLSYLWPDHKVVGERDNSPELLVLANDLAGQTKHRLFDDFGVSCDWFQLQVLLCDYKQAWKSARQYPGRSIDSELVYLLEAEKKWGHKSKLWQARKKCFPIEHLGELQGWQGVRTEAAEALVQYGYLWSDLLYDYRKTVFFSQPAVRL